MKTIKTNHTTKSETGAVLTQLFAHANPKNVEGMARFGIVSKNILGLTTPFLRSLAKIHNGNHPMAIELWNSGVYEARALAAMIGDPKQLTQMQMNAWVKEFDNWAICDGVCIHLFRKTPYAHKAAKQWCKRKEEFVRRAGFTMMATLAVHDKTASDHVFQQYLAIVKKYSTDERNGVKKAVNWALRQIGKRNLPLNAVAIATAEEIRRIDSPAARWIAADALRELRGDAVQKRLLHKK
ncbi:MAG TPA: DNA alkylation repair protein [Bacteroidota bacterium]|nr:DNA alkylation repair protein [Bacteroidota bacterium]